jgi:hypothetical protein
MRGLDVVELSTTRIRIGGKRAFTPMDNTSFSAVAVLQFNLSRDLLLAVYHNPHAARPILTSDLPGCWHFEMNADRTNWILRAAAG